MKNCEELVAYSGDSQLKSYRFQNGIATLELELDHDGSTVQIDLPTKLVFTQTLDFTDDNDIGLLCRLEIVELAPLLRTQRGYYMPPTAFADVMKETQRGLSLAYGQKQSEVEWLVNVIGYDRLFSCLLGEINDVRWAVMEG